MADINELNRQMADEKEKAELIKSALKIVDTLAKVDVDSTFANDDDMDELEALVEKAKKLTKNRLWKLT